MKEINDSLYDKLVHLGIINTEENEAVRTHNVGLSDYSKHLIQPWSIMIDYGLNYWDGDIIKRVLRTKADTPRIEDYEKIIHICQERIRQFKTEPMEINFEEVD